MSPTNVCIEDFGDWVVFFFGKTPPNVRLSCSPNINGYRHVVVNATSGRLEGRGLRV